MANEQMMNEKAIEIIKDYRVLGCGYCHQGNDEVEEAFNIAINALEQQPCEDCISREAVEKITWEEPSYDALNVLTEVRDKVKALPPVKPQRPKGEWIVLREEYEFMGSIVNESRGCKCSNCNKVVRFKSNFCPNCGADMRGEEC